MKKVYLLFALLIISGGVYSMSLDEARQDYLYGDYQEAIKKAQGLEENDEVLYFLGVSYIKMGEYFQAKASLGKLLKKFPQSSLNEQAVIKFADSYFLDKNFFEAKNMYQDALKKYSSSRFQPLLNLRLAQIASKEGNWEEKQKYLSVIKNKYPDSCEMEFVNALEAYGDFFTIQVGAFSTEKNAESISQELRAKYQVYIVKDSNADSPLYKVRVGKFHERDKAEKIYLELLDQGYPACIYP